MTEIKEALNILHLTTQYDVKHSTPLLESIRFLMTEETSNKAAITYINKQVANALTKERAYDILIKILPDCSQSIVEENAKAWAISVISKHECEIVGACRFKFLVALYERCHTNQEFYKFIVTNLLAKIIDTCVWVHSQSAEAENALNCLYFTMKYFASACIVHKRRIEEYVLKFLDSPAKIAVICEAAKCYHILNQIGGAGPNSSIHIKNFEDNFEKLYKTLNVLYNSMFENINEYRDAPDDILNVIKFKDIPTYLGTNDVYKILSRRMENIVIFLIEMLQTDYKTKKTIKPEILQVIQRGLDIHVHGDDNDPNRVLFNQIMQQHQIKLLFLLKALIQSLQNSFMRHSTIKILFRYLARVSECSCYNSNSFYKRTIYDVIKYWLQCSGEQIDAKTYEKLIEIIVKDITPNKTTLVLQINVGNHGKSKGKNSKISTGANDAIANTANTMNSSNETPRIHETQVTNCLGALGLLEILFKSVHLNIKRQTCAQLFHIITGTSMDICVNSFCPPYNSQKCRLALFKVLISIFDQPTFTIDIDLAVNILALAQSSHDIELSQIARDGLKIFEKIVHPIQSAINRPAAQDNVQKYDEHEELSKKQADSNSIKVLSHFLIQSSKSETNVSEDQPESSTDQNLEIDKCADDNDSIVPNVGDLENIEDIEIVTLNPIAEENELKVTSLELDENASGKNISIVEISDNEGVNDNEPDAEEVTIVEPACKKRKADSQEVIYTFDISQGEDLLDSFVDEIN